MIWIFIYFGIFIVGYIAGVLDEKKQHRCPYCKKYMKKVLYNDKGYYHWNCKCGYRLI